MARRDDIRVGVDALHQYAREEEIGEDDDPPVAELRGMFERRLDQREGDARIGRLAPAEAHAFPQHPHDLGDVGIGVGIGRPAPDDQEQRVVKRFTFLPAGREQRLAHAVAGGADHLQIDAELAAIFDRQALVLRLVGVEHRRYVVLGVACGKQHARHGEDLVDAVRPEPVEPVREHRIGEFQIAVADRPSRKPRLQNLGQVGEFADGVLVAAAVATQHDAVSPARSHPRQRADTLRLRCSRRFRRGWHGNPDLPDL